MVDIFKLKFTVLQSEILRFLMLQAGRTFTQNTLAKHLNVSSTAIAKSLDGIKDFILLSKDKESGRIAITLNIHERSVIQSKRVDNLRNIYDSGLYDFLIESFPSATIILFGSYAYGEDTINSDIDIAIFGFKGKNPDFLRFEKVLSRKISVNFYERLNKVDSFLKDNILSGILLEGRIES